MDGRPFPKHRSQSPEKHQKRDGAEPKILPTVYSDFSFKKDNLFLELFSKASCQYTWWKRHISSHKEEV